MRLIIELPDDLKEPKDYFEYFGVWSTKLSEVLEKSVLADDAHTYKQEYDKGFCAGYDNGFEEGKARTRREFSKQITKVFESIDKSIQPKPIEDIKLFNGCSSCKSKDRCEDAFHSHAVHCNAYGKKEI